MKDEISKLIYRNNQNLKCRVQNYQDNQKDTTSINNIINEWTRRIRKGIINATILNKNNNNE